MAKTSIQITKKAKQSSAALFSAYVKKARTFGAMKVLRKRKFFTRTMSENVLKTQTLKKLEKIKKNDRLRKLGKM